MAHYFHDTEKIETFTISIQYEGKEYSFVSAQGMFSKDALDRGTEVLLEHAQVPSEGSMLDLGCGIGIVGVLLKVHNPALMVTQSDITQKAVKLTKQNAANMRVQTDVVQSNVYDSLTKHTFDVILTNPPRAAGKDIIRKMIAQAPAHLNDKGSLQLVALTNKGGKSYEAIMKETFGNVEKIGRGSGFSVYKSVK